MKEIAVGEKDGGQRLNRYLAKLCPAFTVGKIRSGIRKNKIKLNGKKPSYEQVVSSGDILKLFYHDDEFAVNIREGVRPCPDRVLSSEKMEELSVAYEDENIIIADKPRGLLCHEGDNGRDNEPTLINMITAYLTRTGAYDPARDYPFQPALCHRLDRNTAGLVIAAKNARALAEMNRLLVPDFDTGTRSVIKTYTCIVVGRPDPAEGVIKLFLQRDKKSGNILTSTVPKPGFKTAVTAYRTLRTFVREGITLSELEIDLITWRTHQIRVSMAHIGCPVAGDGRYGDTAVNRRLHLKQQLLTASAINFPLASADGFLHYLHGKTVYSKEKNDIGDS